MLPCLRWAVGKSVMAVILPSQGKISTNGDEDSDREGHGVSVTFVNRSPPPQQRHRVQVGTPTLIKHISCLLYFELHCFFFLLDLLGCVCLWVQVIRGFATGYLQKYIYKFDLSLNYLGAMNLSHFFCRSSTKRKVLHPANNMHWSSTKRKVTHYELFFSLWTIFYP